MGGGLINIITSHNTDIFLTGDPQITFYKMVYRRYTNFAMESVYVHFTDNIQFNHENELIPPRIGDLIHKSYLHITLPEINITKHDVGIDNNIELLTNEYIITNYNRIKTRYMVVLSDIYRLIHKSINIYNVSYAEILNECIEYYNDEKTNARQILQEYDSLLLTIRNKLIKLNDNRQIILDSTRSNLWYILQKFNLNTLIKYAHKIINTQIFEFRSDEYNKEIQRIVKNIVFKDIEIGYACCKDVQRFFSDEYVKYNERVLYNKNPNIKCAWVKYIGISIIEYIDIVIGGYRIDRHLGIWIGIWIQLTYKESQIKIFNELIGNVPQLTDFNNKKKPSYDIYVPLSFWFNKFNGLSFPLIAMQYNNIHIYVKLRKFEEVFYIERIYSGKLNGSDILLTANMIDIINKNNSQLTNITEINDINLTDIWSAKGYQLNGHILMDYIYLSQHERKRFAQSGHEYLIDNIQTNIFENIEQQNYDARLDFINPSKEIVWVLTKNCLQHNNYGWNECKWYDHTLNFGIDNPILNASITFNNYTRVTKQAGIYFNKYLPLMHHKVTPTDGVNIYNFSLEPTQHQPSGTCNFSRLGDVRLFLNIDELYFRYTDSQVYPHDMDIYFDIIIDEPEELLENIDIQYAKQIEAEHINYNDAQQTIDIYNKLKNGEYVIPIKTYRKLFLKTKASCYVFDMSINILRLIGGYGALAYTGNS